jgi:hypothetical protein
MKKQFLKYLILWFSQNMSIPVWLVGHLHMHYNEHSLLVEWISRILLDLLLLCAFYINWLEYRKK